MSRRIGASDLRYAELYDEMRGVPTGATCHNEARLMRPAARRIPPLGIHDEVFRGLGMLGVAGQAAITLPGRVLLVALGFASIGAIPSIDLDGWARTVSGVLLAMSVGGTAAWAVIQAARIDSRRRWADYEVEEKRKLDTANKDSLSEQLKKAQEQIEALAVENRQNQQRIRDTGHVNTTSSQALAFQMQLLTDQLDQERAKHAETHGELLSAHKTIIELMKDLEHGMHDMDDKMKKVDRGIRKVAKAVTESTEHPPVNMDTDSDLDGENAGGPVAGESK